MAREYASWKRRRSNALKPCRPNGLGRQRLTVDRLKILDLIVADGRISFQRAIIALGRNPQHYCIESGIRPDSMPKVSCRRAIHVRVVRCRIHRTPMRGNGVDSVLLVT